VSKAYPSRQLVGTALVASEVESQFLPPVVKAVQVTQSVAASEPAGEPYEASHAKQSATSSFPVVSAYVPAGQLVQELALAAEYVPAPHIVHVLEIKAYPAIQAVGSIAT